jgi:hopanoid C-3 methylase
VTSSVKRILLVRPRSPNERFGLGPFFRVEPLGLEYVAAGLLRAGHHVRITDERFSIPLRRQVVEFQPDIVGISCMHTVDIPTALEASTTAKQANPRTVVVMGGHVVSLYPEPFFEPDVDALCMVDGEIAFAEFVSALQGVKLNPRCPGFWVRLDEGRGKDRFSYTPWTNAPDELCSTPLPARQLVDEFRSRYLCVHKQPIWAVETARGCPYRCSFCSTSLRYDRQHRSRDTAAVIADFESTGNSLFIVDDLFFSPASYSAELARALRSRDIRKSWVLVQTRLDTIARHPQLLEQWRPVAESIDLFCGFEAPTDAQLSDLNKDMTSDSIEEGVRVARHYGYGVTGNFVIDPDWDEQDFERLWAMVDRLKLNRLGYTVLTPLPGTPLFAATQDRILDWDWSKWDMHHVLYEPKLGRRRFFELFVECWRRNVLGARHAGHWLRWLRGLTFRQGAALAQVLWRTQRLLDTDAYLDETFPLQVPAQVTDGSPGRRKNFQDLAT